MDENEWMDRLEAEELARLDAHYRTEVEIAIEVCRRTGQPYSGAYGDGDVYAYPRPGKGIAWGVNAPLNIARAIRRTK
jgi:hypothetical protein